MISPNSISIVTTDLFRQNVGLFYPGASGTILGNHKIELRTWNVLNTVI